MCRARICEEGVLVTTGPVSTAKASSFLNCPGGTGVVVSVTGTGCRCSQVVGQFRRAGTARPATRPRPAPVAGLRSGQPPAGAEGPELQVRLGQPSAAFRPRVREHRGGGQVLGPPGPGEFV